MGSLEEIIRETIIIFRIIEYIILLFLIIVLYNYRDIFIKTILIIILMRICYNYFNLIYSNIKKYRRELMYYSIIMIGLYYTYDEETMRFWDGMSGSRIMYYIYV